MLRTIYVVSFTLISIFVSFQLRKKLDSNRIYILLKVICWISFFCYFLEALYILLYEPFKLSMILPLWLCSLLRIFMTIAVYKKVQIFYEITFFNIIIPIIGIIPTMIDPMYQSPLFVASYDIGHLTIILVTLMMTICLNVKFSKFSIVKVLIFNMVYQFILYFINILLDSNIMFLNRYPAEYNEYAILQWPYYIILINILHIFISIFINKIIFYINKKKYV